MEKKSFYDYINELRIEEFKIIVVLPENQKFTLLSLAYDVGFNSKTSFNRNFKNITGLSPTAYLQQQKIQLQATT
ncbi:Helix-turn-helix domain protein [compost metagenome]